MAQRIDVVPQHLFRSETNKLIPAFGPELVAMHHLGSIGQSGPQAKPIVELWVEVNNIEKITNFDLRAGQGDDEVMDGVTRQMTELGYTPWGEQGVTGRRFFSKDTDPAATYCIHVYQFGHFQPGYPRNAADWGRLMHWLVEPNQGEFVTLPTKPGQRQRSNSDLFRVATGAGY